MSVCAGGVRVCVCVWKKNIDRLSTDDRRRQKEWKKLKEINLDKAGKGCSTKDKISKK